MSWLKLSHQECEILFGGSLLKMCFFPQWIRGSTMVKIFIGNLAAETTTDELRSLFSQYGKIAECDIVKNYGFVHMDNKAEAEEAIRNLHHYELNGQPMNVELSRGKSRGSTKLHVGNIACTNQELRAKFEEFGAVLECDIVKNYAFVHMERMEDAMEVINKLDNSAFKGELLGWGNFGGLHKWKNSLICKII